MKLYACFSPSHRILYDRFFAPTVPRSFDLHAWQIPHQHVTTANTYRSDCWEEALVDKVDWQIEACAENQGAYVVFADVDLVFFGDPVPDLLSRRAHDMDFYFMEGRQGFNRFNTGFFMMRCNAHTLKLLEDVRVELAAKRFRGDQEAMRRMIDRPELSWEFLPFDSYSLQHENFDALDEVVIPCESFVHHATKCPGPKAKEEYLSHVIKQRGVLL